MTKLLARDKEALVLAVIDAEGNATIPEICKIINDEGIEIDLKTCARYVSKWKDRGTVAIKYLNGKRLYKIAKIPPWFSSKNMLWMLKESKLTGIKDLTTKLLDWVSGERIEPLPIAYKTYEVTIETIDPILGGKPIDDADGSIDKPLKFPRLEDGRPYIAGQIIRAWHRDNFPKVGVHKWIYRNCAFGDALPLDDEVKMDKRRGRSIPRAGYTWYESIESKQRFKFAVDVPCKGTKLNDAETMLTMYESIAVRPIRGLGANPFVYGGKVKCVELLEV